MNTPKINATNSSLPQRIPLTIHVSSPIRGYAIVLGVFAGVILLLAQVVMALAFPSIKSMLSALPTPLTGAFYALLTCPLLFGVIQLNARSAIRTIKRTEQAWLREPGPEIIPILFELGTRLFSDKRILAQVARTLRTLGFTSRPIIVHWSRPAPPFLPPIDVPVGPIPLDEADPAFHALEVGTVQAADEEANGSRRSVSDELTMRRLRKTYLYTGVLFTVVMMSFLFVLTAIASILARRFDAMLIFFGLMLLLASLPLLMGGSIGPVWLLVPGGLVLRKPKKRGMTSAVHLFRPEQTVLYICQLNKRLWHMVVADGSEFGTSNLSDKELTMLLRAWCSPLAPPSPEKLIDLT